jgi:DNA-binding NtrC family response regulator
MYQEVPDNRPLVLVVEMDPMCRRVVERILRPRCRIMTSSDYDEILDLLKTNSFDTLFVDNDLPSPGVIQLFKTAIQLSPHTKRILMTGEHVENLQYYLQIGLINSFVTRTTPGKTIEAEVAGNSRPS